MLVGRHEERRRIAGMLAAARRGGSAALVLRGEPGIGKTALLEYAAVSARGMTVLRTRGIESESELAFSGLLELVRPLLADLDRLPARQAAALKGALALEAAEAADPFAVYAGTFGLLAAAAEEQPLLALIDDAQWLDEASANALAFASRRFRNEGVAVLWAIRDPEPTHVSTDGLGELRLGGLDDDAALALVTRAADDVAAEAARALVEAANGNPLALLELPMMLTDSQREGRAPLDQPLAVTPALQNAFGRRVERLPEATRMLLLLAAANDAAELGTVIRAAELLQLEFSQLEPAERAGLIKFGDGRFEFRHPLVRAAVYANADPAKRRQAHGVLAEALLDARTQARRAWHRALATVEPDEDVAAELEATALRSQSSSHAAARAYEQAAQLTLEDEARARRLLAAAREWDEAGRNDSAKRLLEDAATLTADPALLTGIEHLLGRILWAQGESSRASKLLEGAAARVEDADPERAALILADAAEASLARDPDRAEAAARRAWELGRERHTITEIWVALRYADVLAWRGEVERATELWLHAASISPGEDLRARYAVGEALFSAAEDARASEVLEEMINAARAAGALGLLPSALHVLSLVELRRGRLAASAEAAAEAYELAQALDQRGERRTALSALAWVEALLGRETACREHVAEASELRRGLGHENYANVAAGMLELTLGRWDEAFRHLRTHADEVRRRSEADAIAPRSFIPELIEAAVRTGEREQARAALEPYEAVAARSDRPSALAPALRCRGLLEADDGHFKAALREHDRWGNPFERARTHLVFGEHLRRQKRRAEARVHLRAAIAGFEEVGAATWAERARAELEATGERARRRDPSTLDTLTPQELKVARLVATGLTNREVAERLFLSRKTIETHLGHVFAKTGVRTRAELAHKFRDSPDLIAAGAS